MKGAGGGSRSEGSRSEEQRSTGSRSEEQGAQGAEEHKHEEQGAGVGAVQCAHAIGASISVAVRSAVEQALQRTD